jgi:signal peptidase I
MHRPLRRLVAVVFIGMIAAAGGAVATGRIGYEVTNGVSMEPTYRDGDFVVIMPTNSYHSGDIVAYHGGEDGHLLLLHRIIGGSPNGYVVKGDNNQSTDPTQPAADQIVGRAVLHVPKVGAVLDSPVTRGLLVVAALALLGGLLVNPQPRLARAHRPSRRSRRIDLARKALVGLDIALLIAVALVYALPSAPAVAAAVPPTQTGSFTYGADVPVSVTYPTGRLATGDPVFTKLLTTIAVTFRYSTTAVSGSVSGTVRLDADLSTPSGWHTTLPLVPPSAMVAGALNVTGALDLAQIQSLATAVAQDTGTGTAAIAVTIRASLSVSIDGAEPVTSTSELPFQLTALELALANVKPTPSPTGPVITTTTPLSTTAADPVHSPADVRHQATLGLLASLVLGVGTTIVIWPSTSIAEPSRSTPSST